MEPVKSSSLGMEVNVVTCIHPTMQDFQFYVSRDFTNDEMLNLALEKIKEVHPSVPPDQWTIHSFEGHIDPLPEPVVVEAEQAESQVEDVDASPFRKKRDSKVSVSDGFRPSGGSPALKKVDMKRTPSKGVDLEELTSNLSSCITFKDSSTPAIKKGLFSKDNNNNGSLEDIHALDFEIPKTSTVVKISKLCAPFWIGAFEQVINHAISEKGEDPNGWIKDIRDYSEEEGSVIVEFSNSNQALQVSAMPIKWMLQPVVFEVYHNHVEVHDKNVVVGNIPKPYSEELLRSYLLRVMEQERIITEGQNVIVSCSSYKENEKSVTVQFDSHEISSALVKCKEMDYLWGGKVSFTWTKGSSPPIKTGPSVDHSIAPVPLVKEDEIKEEATVRVPTDVSEIPLSTCWFGYETCQLLMACIENRDLLKSKSTKKMGQGWRYVETAMLSKGLNFGLPVLKTRLKSLRNYGLKAGPDYEYSSLINEFEGTSPMGSGKIPERYVSPTPVKSTKKTEGPQPKSFGAKSKNTKASKMWGIAVIDGTVVVEADQCGWDTERDFFLIDEYSVRKKRFDDDKTHSTVLWSEISSAFNRHFPKEKASSEKLCNRMAYLGMQFKVRYDNLMNCTGSSADALNWSCYDKMARLFEGCHTLQPSKLVSFGAVCSTIERSPNSSEDYDCNESPDNRVKLKKDKKEHTPTIRERKALACEAMLEEVRLANKLFMENQKKKD